MAEVQAVFQWNTQVLQGILLSEKAVFSLPMEEK